MSDAGVPEHQPQAAPSDGMRSLPLLLAAVACFFVFGGGYIFLGTGLMVLLVSVAPPPGVAWRPARLGPVLVMYVPFALLWIAVAVGYLRWMAVLEHPVEPQAGLLQLLSADLVGWPWLRGILLAVILAPVAEEILFRGYLFTALRSVLPMWLTQLLTASLFGLLHGLGHALPIAVLSLLFGYLRQRYHSLLPSILAHAMHNGLTVALLSTWPDLIKLFYDLP